MRAKEIMMQEDNCDIFARWQLLTLLDASLCEPEPMWRIATMKASPGTWRRSARYTGRLASTTWAQWPRLRQLWQCGGNDNCGWLVMECTNVSAKVAWIWLQTLHARCLRVLVRLSIPGWAGGSVTYSPLAIRNMGQFPRCHLSTINAIRLLTSQMIENVPLAGPSMDLKWVSGQETDWAGKEVTSPSSSLPGVQAGGLTGLKYCCYVGGLGTGFLENCFGIFR